MRVINNKVIEKEKSNTKRNILFFIAGLIILGGLAVASTIISDTSVTTTGDVSAVNVVTTQNVTASYFLGDGSKLTGITAGGNASFNQTLTDLLYANHIWSYNQTATALFYNQSNTKYYYNMTQSAYFYNMTNSPFFYNMTGDYSYNQTQTIYFYNMTDTQYYYNMTDNRFYYNMTQSPYFYNQTDNKYYYNQTESPYFYNQTLAALVYVDANFIDSTTNEVIAGVKTFSSIPILPAVNPTNDNEAVRKAYVDNILVYGFTWQEPVINLSGKSNNTFGVPNIGDRYIVYPPGADNWTGSDNNVTEWNGTQWVFYEPELAWTVLELDSNKIYRYDNNSAESFKWVQVSATAGSTASLGVKLVGTDFQADLATLATGENVSGINISGNSMGINYNSTMFSIVDNQLTMQTYFYNMTQSPYFYNMSQTPYFYNMTGDYSYNQTTPAIDYSNLNFYNKSANILMTGFNVTSNWFFGAFNWIVSFTAPSTMATFNGTTLWLNSTFFYNLSDTKYYYNQSDTKYYYNQSATKYYYNQSDTKYYYNQSQTQYYYNQTQSPYFYNQSSNDYTNANFYNKSSDINTGAYNISTNKINVSQTSYFYGNISAYANLDIWHY